MSESNVRRLTNELRALADRLDLEEERRAFPAAWSDYGAALLELSATIAHICQIQRETFAGFARVAWRAREPKRRPN